LAPGRRDRGDLLARALDREAERDERLANRGRVAAQQTEHDVLGPDVVVTQADRFLLREREHALGAVAPAGERAHRHRAFLSTISRTRSRVAPSEASSFAAALSGSSTIASRRCSGRASALFRPASQKARASARFASPSRRSIGPPAPNVVKGPPACAPAAALSGGCCPSVAITWWRIFSSETPRDSRTPEAMPSPSRTRPSSRC